MQDTQGINVATTNKSEMKKEESNTRTERERNDESHSIAGCRDDYGDSGPSR